MANEIQIKANLKCENGSFKLPTLGSSSFNVDQTTRGGGVPGMISAATAGTDVTTTGITSLGWCYLKNTDPTNFVEWGPKDSGTFYPIGKLLPGEECVFRLSPGKTLHVKADTAACKVQIVVLDA